MQIEPNLYIEDKKNKISAKGIHDVNGKCVILKAGSQYIKSNFKKEFFQYPPLQKFYESKIIPCSSTSGNDSIFYIQQDIPCYSLENTTIDELTVASSIVYGKLVKGINVWKNLDGILLKNVNSVSLSDISLESDPKNNRYKNASKTVYDMLNKEKNNLIKILSYAYFINCILGNQNEDRFTVPRQVDRGGMSELGFECVETESYDLIVPGDEQFTASDKIGKEIFHQKTSKKARVNFVSGEIAMSNIRSGQSSHIVRPQFDCLILMQYNPFIVCGVVSYDKLVKHFRGRDGGFILQKLPIENIDFIISPTECYRPLDIPEESKPIIHNFVEDERGGLMRKLLDIPLEIPDDPSDKIWKK